MQGGRRFEYAADERLATFVRRVCFARIDHLERADLLNDSPESFEVAEQQIGTFVGRGTACESKRKRGRIELNTRALLDLGQ